MFLSILYLPSSISSTHKVGDLVSAQYIAIAFFWTSYFGNCSTLPLADEILRGEWHGCVFPTPDSTGKTNPCG
jgi:hypothetical protein